MAFEKQSKEAKERAKKKRTEAKERYEARVSSEAQFACLAYLSCADSPPKRSEGAYVAAFLANQDDIGALPTKITASSMADVTKEALPRRVRAYSAACNPSLPVRRRFLEALFALAVCDGPLHLEEANALEQIATLLRFPPEKYQSLQRRWHVQTDPSAGSKTRQKAVDLGPTPPPWCYEVLGCSHTDSDDVIRRSYRRLAAKLHPDKHAAKNPTAAESVQHLRAFQRLQAAYDEIRRYRSKLTEE